METGLRPRVQQREVIFSCESINQFVCRYTNELVFSVDLTEGRGCHPILSLLRAENEVGRLDVIWKRMWPRFALRTRSLVG